MNATNFVLLASQKTAGDVYLFIVTCGILCILCILSIMWANYRNQRMLESTNIMLGKVLNGLIEQRYVLESESVVGVGVDDEDEEEPLPSPGGSTTEEDSDAIVSP